MDNDAKQLYSIEKVSEIARQALKQLVSDGKPAIPPIYEKVFYKKAVAMGESAIVDQLMAKLPTGQAAAVLVEKLAKMMSGLDQNMKDYRQGIEVHTEQISGKQEEIKELVDPGTWGQLEKHLTGVVEANSEMKQRVLEAEKRIREQEDYVSKLQNKIRFDPLTGALNRHALNEDLSAEFIRCKRYKRPLTVVIADIDFFKKINDTHGHATGDEVLKAVVELMLKALRDVDNVYRYGGEEFVVLLPETDGKGALVAAERLRKIVEKYTLKHKTDASLKVSVTISLGVATHNYLDPDYQAIINRADEALYRAKNGGRNRVEAGFQ